MRHILERKPWQDQRDNHLFPNGACGPTGSINALHAIGLEMPHAGFEQEEDFFTDWLEKPAAVDYMYKHYPFAKGSTIRPRHFGEILAWGVNQIMKPVVGADVAFRKPRTLVEMAQAIFRDQSLVVSCNFTSAGHFIALCGVEIADDVANLEELKESDILAFFCDDSWGNYNTNYKDRNGNNVRYAVHILRDMMKGREVGMRWVTNLFSNPAHDGSTSLTTGKGGYVPAA